MSVPLGEFSFKARHFSVVWRQHIQIFRDLLGSLLPLLGSSDGWVHIVQIKPANTRNMTEITASLVSLQSWRRGGHDDTFLWRGQPWGGTIGGHQSSLLFLFSSCRFIRRLGNLINDEISDDIILRISTISHMIVGNQNKTHNAYFYVALR